MWQRLLALIADRKERDRERERGRERETQNKIQSPRTHPQ
jgi:hypothetical protein